MIAEAVRLNAYDFFPDEPAFTERVRSKGSGSVSAERSVYEPTTAGGTISTSMVTAAGRETVPFAATTAFAAASDETVASIVNDSVSFVNATVPVKPESNFGAAARSPYPRRSPSPP